MRYAALLALLFLLPSVVLAATVRADQLVEVIESPADNAYLAGGEVRITVALPEDLIAAAGMLRITAPIGGDLSAAGGTIELGAPVSGDVRVAGGRILISDAVAGDLAAFGGYVRVAGEPGDVNVAGGSVELVGGARGPVSAYGGIVMLQGEFADDVHVVASDRIVIGEDTIIHGTLEYNAPQEAVIPESAELSAVEYVGSASFLPTAEEAQAFALAGVGIFLIVRLIAVVLASGLLAGLFPVFSRKVVDEVLAHSFSGFMRALVIGLAVMFLTPILVVLLLASFVGMGLAALIGLGYVFLLLLAYFFAAIVAGSALARATSKRESVLWRDGALGMLVLYIIGIVPVAGFLIGLILSAAALGAIISIAYAFAFGKEAS